MHSLARSDPPPRYLALTRKAYRYQSRATIELSRPSGSSFFSSFEPCLNSRLLLKAARPSSRMAFSSPRTAVSAGAEPATATDCERPESYDDGPSKFDTLRVWPCCCGCGADDCGVDW